MFDQPYFPYLIQISSVLLLFLVFLLLFLVLHLLFLVLLLLFLVLLLLFLVLHLIFLVLLLLFLFFLSEPDNNFLLNFCSNENHHYWININILCKMLFIILVIIILKSLCEVIKNIKCSKYTQNI
jgi:hypothetical protein